MCLVCIVRHLPRRMISKTLISSVSVKTEARNVQMESRGKKLLIEGVDAMYVEWKWLASLGDWQT